MTTLHDPLDALRGQLREWAADLRRHALMIDESPERIGELLGLPALAYLSTLGVPPGHGGPVLRVGPHRFDGMDTLERVVAMEELACGDAGMLLAAPGPSMSGVLIEQLADEAQQKLFYERLLAAPTWTFFGLTEPGHGSDATAIETSLTRVDDQTLRLDGTKRYIGNGVRAQFGVVFARTGSGPLGRAVVLVDTACDGFSAEPIETLGLRGARISQLRLQDVRVGADRVLGRHLSATRRGTWAAIQVFNRLRPAVAAIAVGIARAAYEHGRERMAAYGPRSVSALQSIEARIAATRSLVHQAARAAGQPGNGQLTSAAKLSACRLAEQVTVEICTLLGPVSRLEDPVLDKLVRDARGVEFMEGTRNIQRLNLFPALLAARPD